MGSNRLVLPVLNKKVVTFRSPSWYLDSDVYWDTINDEDFGAFNRADPAQEYKSQLEAKTKCIYVTPIDPNNIEPFSRVISAILKFVFNVFASDGPVILPWAAHFQEKRKVKLMRIVDLEAVANLHRLRQRTYTIEQHQKPETVTEFFKTARQVCSSYPSVLFALERFNSCMTRSEFLDKIVDATVSLESLIRARDELRFRFALYLSFISQKDPSPREVDFGYLQTLYDARSGIVHGDINPKDVAKDIASVETNWSEIMRIMRSCLIYYLMYLRDKGNDAYGTWAQHQKNLVLGLDKRIID